MPATRGQTVLFNESGNPDAPSLAIAQILMTDSDPTTDEIAAIVAAPDWGGAYPAQPATGQVLLGYQQMVSNTPWPTQAYAYAYEGTGPNEYQALA